MDTQALPWHTRRRKKQLLIYRLDFAFVLFALVLPQAPMTVGNAVLANADLANTYFGPDAKRVTAKALCISMALANVLAFLFGGIPMCHGAGGLAAHYRFGARTAGSNLMIGGLMLLATLLFSNHLMALFHLIPFAVLGVLLLFAGGQLALTIIDLETRGELFVSVVIWASHWPPTWPTGSVPASCCSGSFAAGTWMFKRQSEISSTVLSVLTARMVLAILFIIRDISFI
jgi:hypothetical protein